MFLKNPQKYFVRNVLGVYPGSQENITDEHEPFVLDTLQKYLVEQDMVQTGAGKNDQQLQRQQIQAAGQWPLGTPGDIDFIEKQQEMLPFVERVIRQKEKERENDRFIQGEFYDLHLSGRIGSLYSNGSFLFRYARLKGQDVLNGWLHHCLMAICLDDPKETILLAKDTEVVFPAGSVEREDLQMLIELFREGQQSPSRLLVEPAFACALQSVKTEKSGKGDPAAKAITAVEKIFNSGFEPEWELLYQGQDQQAIMSQDFFDLCDWFYESIWKRADVRDI